MKSCRSKRFHGSSPSVCAASLCAKPGAPDVYLEFYPDDSLWCLVRYTTTLGTTAYSTVHTTSTLMEIEGAINDPPIDLALAMLALRGY